MTFTSKVKPIIPLRNTMNKIIIVIICVVSAMTTIAQPLKKMQTIDKVVAKVDDKIVLKSEVEFACENYKQQGGFLGETDDVCCKALEAFLLNKLMAAKAETDSITVDDATIDGE